jgi:hypothetical protein
MIERGRESGCALAAGEEKGERDMAFYVCAVYASYVTKIS